MRPISDPHVSGAGARHGMRLATELLGVQFIMAGVWWDLGTKDFVRYFGIPRSRIPQKRDERF